MNSQFIVTSRLNMAMMVKGGDDGVVVVENFPVMVALGPSILPLIRFYSANARLTTSYTRAKKSTDYVISEKMQD